MPVVPLLAGTVTPNRDANEAIVCSAYRGACASARSMLVWAGDSKGRGQGRGRNVGSKTAPSRARHPYTRAEALLARVVV